MKCSWNDGTSGASGDGCGCGWYEVGSTSDSTLRVMEQASTDRGKKGKACDRRSGTKMKEGVAWVEDCHRDKDM